MEGAECRFRVDGRVVIGDRGASNNSEVKDCKIELADVFADGPPSTSIDIDANPESCSAKDCVESIIKSSSSSPMPSSSESSKSISRDRSEVKWCTRVGCFHSHPRVPQRFFHKVWSSARARQRWQTRPQSRRICDERWEKIWRAISVGRDYTQRIAKQFQYHL